MNVISSPTNPHIMKIASLKTKKGRDKLGLFMVEGTRAIMTFFNAGWRCTELIFLRDADNPFSDYTQQAAITYVTLPLMKKISATTTSSGYIALFRIPPLAPLVSKPGIVLLDIHDPGNMGTLIRTAVAFNVQCIIIDGCDPFHPKVTQASAGALSVAHIVQTNWEELIDMLPVCSPSNPLNLVALVPSGGKKPAQVDLTNALLVIGNEAHGIPENIITQCNALMTIPVPGNLESLNAAIAGAIGLYIQYNQRHNTSHPNDVRVV